MCWPGGESDTLRMGGSRVASQWQSLLSHLSALEDFTETVYTGL